MAPRKSKNVGASQTAKNTKAIKTLKSKVKPEKKYLDYNVTTPATFDRNGGVYPLSLIAQGLQPYNRIGNEVYGQRIRVNWKASMDPAIPNTMVGVLLVMDTMNQGSNPTVEQVIETAGLASAPLEFPDEGQRGRFKVLKHGTFSLGDDGINAITKHWSASCKTKFHFTSSSNTSTFKNALFLVVLSDQSSNLPSINFCSRFNYLDD